MFVINRSGKKINIQFDEILNRIKEISDGLDIDHAYLSKLVITGLVDGMKTKEIDSLTTKIAYCMSTYNLDYDKLCSRLSISNLHKNTTPDLKVLIEQYKIAEIKSGKQTNLLDSEIEEYYINNVDILQSNIKYERDYKYSYMGFKTLENGYLFKRNNKTIERPQHKHMRISLGLFGPNKKSDDKGDIKNQL